MGFGVWVLEFRTLQISMIRPCRPAHGWVTRRGRRRGQAQGRGGMQRRAPFGPAPGRRGEPAPLSPPAQLSGSCLISLPRPPVGRRGIAGDQARPSIEAASEGDMGGARTRRAAAQHVSSPFLTHPGYPDRAGVGLHGANARGTAHTQTHRTAPRTVAAPFAAPAAAFFDMPTKNNL